VPTAKNGNVEIYFETFGSPVDPTLLLVNGLGSQCINFATEWCAKFAAEGFHVVRFDNRDVGLSSKLDGEEYTLADMADDGFAVLDALGVERAHVMGLSLGGMVVQRMAVGRPERLLSLTSVMSMTGERDYGQPTPEALAELMRPAATSREEYVANYVAGLQVIGSKPEWLDLDRLAALAGAAYDRCFHPAGLLGQMRAVMADEGRAEALRHVRVPTLVIHGSRDPLIDPSGGRRTAELIPGARYVEIDGMGHDYPPAVWDQWVGLWADFARSI